MKQDVYISLYENKVYIQRNFEMSNYFIEMTYICIFVYTCIYDVSYYPYFAKTLMYLLTSVLFHI